MADMLDLKSLLKAALVFGIYKNGFSLLELMVAIFLFGIVATFIVPNLQNFIPGYQRKTFLNNLEVLVQVAWQQSIITQKAHRVFFDIPQRTARIEIETDKKGKEGDSAFEPITIAYLATVYQWPVTIEFKQFFIEDREMISRAGVKTEQVWFYISPDGLAQSVIINIVDNAEVDQRGKPIAIGLRLNPFSARFKEYEQFQKL
jgi:prepilin-type N-terminal cleavage/methylation domain-containing protein